MEENKQIEKFDPASLMDGVKNRIKATFVSLIPDAQWEEMCNAEMDKFFKPQYEKDYNGRPKLDKPLPSEFETLVLSMMKEHCGEFLKELFDSPQYKVQEIWKGDGKDWTVSEHIDNMIKEKMPEMMQAMFTKFIANGFYQLFANVQSQMSTGVRGY